MHLFSRFATSALVGLMLASLALPNAHATPIIPGTVDPSTVVVGTRYISGLSFSDASEPGNYLPVYASDLDGSYRYTVPDTYSFLPGLYPNYALAKWADAYLASSDGAIAEAAWVSAVTTYELGSGSIFDASDTFFVDLTDANAAALEAVNRNSLGWFAGLLVDILIPAGPRLTDQIGFDALVQSVVETAEGQFSLRSDDPGLLTTLASLPTTYSPSASPVPEIDPASFGSVLALVTGTLGLLERRRLKVKAA